MRCRTEGAFYRGPLRAPALLAKGTIQTFGRTVLGGEEPPGPSSGCLNKGVLWSALPALQSSEDSSERLLTPSLSLTTRQGQFGPKRSDDSKKNKRSGAQALCTWLWASQENLGGATLAVPHHRRSCNVSLPPSLTGG